MVKKFLLIDDDMDDRDLFCEAVEAVDVQIICYVESDGRKALEKLDSKKIENPDVVFLDVNMPLMNGWECLRHLKSSPALKDIPIIMYSTSCQKEELEKARRLGAISFLKKPTDFNSLKNNLEVLVNYIEEGSLGAFQPGSPLLSIFSS